MRSSTFLSKATSDKTDHRIDILLLSIVFLSMFSCLIRSDYNFAIGLFLYFIWQQRKDMLALRMIVATLTVLFIADFIFTFMELPVWTANDKGNNVWQTLLPLHNFAIFIFAVVNLIKIILMIVVCQGISQAKVAGNPANA